MIPSDSHRIMVPMSLGKYAPNWVLNYSFRGNTTRELWFHFTRPILMIRTAKKDLTSRAPGGSFTPFKYPERGAVICEDWKDSKQCGNGMHGVLLDSSGTALITYDTKRTTKFLLMEVETSEIVDLHDKIKVPRANVVAVCNNRTALANAYKDYVTHDLQRKIYSLTYKFAR